MPGIIKEPQTLYDKVLENHIVNEQSDGTLLLYIDRHLVHEVTSPVSRARNIPERPLSSSSKPLRAFATLAARSEGLIALWLRPIM